MSSFQERTNVGLRDLQLIFKLLLLLVHAMDSCTAYHQDYTLVLLNPADLNMFNPADLNMSHNSYTTDT